MVSRRMMMAGGAAAALLGVLGYRSWDRGVFTVGQGPAYEAWSDWQGRPGEGTTRPLHAAILSSSAHNTQPWLFEAQGDAITVCADLSRNLGAADPFRRELYASIGCALHNLALEAGAFPDRLEPDMRDPLVVDPAPGVRRICDLRLGPPQNRLQKFRLLTQRHTHRGAYLPDRPVPADVVATNDFVTYIRDPGAMKELGALIVEATAGFIADPAMSRDSGRWMRTDRRAIEHHRDGVTIDTAGLSPVMTAVAKLLPDQETATADQYWLRSTRDVQVPTAAAFGVIFADNRLIASEALRAGSAWQRFQLAATAAGLVAQPMNAPIELMDRAVVLGKNDSYGAAIRSLAGVHNGDPAFLFRLGYAEHPAPPSPRRRFDDVLKRSA